MFRSFAFVSATVFLTGVSNSAPSFKTNFYFPRPTPKIEYWSWQLLLSAGAKSACADEGSLSEGRGCVGAMGIFHTRTNSLWTQACSMGNHCHVFSGGTWWGFSGLFLPSRSLPNNSPVRLNSFLLPSHKVIQLSPFYNLLSSSNNNSNNNIQSSAKREKVIKSSRLQKPSKIRIQPFTPSHLLSSSKKGKELQSHWGWESPPRSESNH